MKAGGQHAHAIPEAEEQQPIASGRESPSRYSEPVRLEIVSRRTDEGAAIRGLAIAAAISTPFWLAVYFMLR